MQIISSGMLVKKLLKRHRYPPEGMEDAVKTVLEQCELWTDNADLELQEYSGSMEEPVLKAAEPAEN